MTISIQEFAQALYLALQEAREEDHDRIINNLVEELRLENRLADFEKIVEAFEAILELDEQNPKAEIALTGITLANKKLMDEINSLTGGNATITQDETLIGGMVVRIDDTLVDGSVKGDLNKIKNEMTE
jgi:F-type H+-transporting ATPase subunit delta